MMILIAETASKAAQQTAEIAKNAAQQTADVAQAAAQQTQNAVTIVWPSLPDHWPAQGDLLTWASNMGALTAAMLVLAGCVYLLFGIYAYRTLVTINAAVVGAYIGGIIGMKVGNATAGAM